MIPTDTRIDILLAYEKYIPVLTPAELEGLAIARPSLAVLQVWQERLINHRARLEAVFGRAYEKINLKYGKERIDVR